MDTGIFSLLIGGMIIGGTIIVVIGIIALARAQKKPSVPPVQRNEGNAAQKMAASQEEPKPVTPATGADAVHIELPKPPVKPSV